jgi:hypothetical protein
MGPMKRSKFSEEQIAWFQATFAADVRRACALAQFSRAAWYRPRRAKDQTALRLWK